VQFNNLLEIHNESFGGLRSQEPKTFCYVHIKFCSSVEDIFLFLFQILSSATGYPRPWRTPVAYCNRSIAIN